MMLKPLLFSGGLLFVYLLSTSVALATCNPRENCVKCQVTNPFNGKCILKAEAADCVLRRQACKGCLAATALEAGVTYKCVLCVIGAVASSGTSTAACVPVCGGATAISRFNRANKC